MTRAQMATFLVRAAEYRSELNLEEGPDAFSDDSSSVHEANINRSATAGFASGVTSTRFDPGGTVRRDQMASFIVRVLDFLVDSGGAPPPGVGEDGGEPSDPPTDGDRTVFVSELTVIQESIFTEVGPASVNAEDYLRSYMFEFSNCSACTTYSQFDLQRTYDLFQATVGLRDDSRSDSVIDGTVVFEVIADGELLSVTEATVGESFELDVDVSGKLRLALQVRQGTNSEIAVWGDARVIDLDP